MLVSLSGLLGRGLAPALAVDDVAGHGLIEQEGDHGVQPGLQQVEGEDAGQQQSVRELSDGSAAGTLRFSLPDDSASAKFFFLRMDYGPLCCKAVGE